MRKVEYKMLYYQDRHEAEEAMNEYADLGWKLDKFEVIHVGTISSPKSFYLVLKREA